MIMIFELQNVKKWKCYVQKNYLVVIFLTVLICQLYQSKKCITFWPDANVGGTKAIILVSELYRIRYICGPCGLRTVLLPLSSLYVFQMDTVIGKVWRVFSNWVIVDGKPQTDWNSSATSRRVRRRNNGRMRNTTVVDNI